MMVNKKIGLFGIALSLFFGFVCVENTYAAIDDSDAIMQKIYYSGAVKCYETTEDDGGLRDSVTLDEFKGTAASLGSSTWGLTAEALTYGDEDTHITCSELLTNKTVNHFAADGNGITFDQKKTILNNMAYSSSRGGGSVGKSTCAQYPYTLVYDDGKTDTFYTPGVCITKDGNNWVFSVDNTVGLTEVGYPKPTPVYFDNEGTNTIRIRYSYQGGLFGNLHGKVALTVNGNDSAQAVLASVGDTILETIGSTENNSTKLRSVLKSQGRDGVNAKYWSLCPNYVATLDANGLTCGVGAEQNMYNVTFYNSGEGSGENATEYKKIVLNNDGEKNNLVKKLSNNKFTYALGTNSLKFTDMQTYRLYQSYLTDVYHAKIDCFATENNGAGVGPIRLWDASFGYNGYCYAVVDDENQKVNGLFDNTGYFGAEISLRQMIDQINALGLTTPPSDPIDTGDGSATDEAISEGCYGAGLESQSWILCPTLNNMTSVVDGVDKIVGDMLSVDTNYFNQDNKTYTVWEIFRNIANTAMVVILLVIIFSQLTGYGIDNYGIKKMLPKLVLMAILINLSFFICEIIIDISNILGVGLNSLFRGMGDATYTGGGWVDDLLGSIFTVAAAGGATAGAAVTVGSALAGGSGPMIIISMILVLLVALVSVLMFFLAVGARLVIIILFTAISPLAFACYILPNTQKMFKKWWDIFKAALIVYPICGALYGLSFLIRSMVHVQGAGNQPLDQFPLMLVAAAAPFLPFLVLPSLLKGALAGLGAVSGAITSIGNGLRKGLTRGNQALQGTSAYKNQQEAQRRNMTRWRAGVTRDADGKYTSRDLSGIGRFLRGGKSGIADARAQLLRDENAQAKEDSYMGEGFDAAVIGQQKAVEADTTKDYITLANSLTQNGEDKGALYDLYRKYEEEGNKSGMVAVARIAGRRKDTASDFMKEFAGNGKVLNASVAKEVATGENSGMYRSSNPFMFEYAAQLNKGEFKGSFDQWKTPDNLNRAVKNYITSAKDLVGMKGDALETLKEAMANDRFDPETKARIRTLATDAIESRAYNNEFDSTKAKQVAELSGAYEYKIKNNRAVFEKQQNATEFDVPHGDGPVDDAGQII